MPFQKLNNFSSKAGLISETSYVWVTEKLVTLKARLQNKKKDSPKKCYTRGYFYLALFFFVATICKIVEVSKSPVLYALKKRWLLFHIL